MCYETGQIMCSQHLIRDHGPSQNKDKERGRKSPTRPTPPEPPDDSEWQDELLAVLRKMDPAAFERLCQRVLRESGFSKVEVTGRSGDGGIDGAGVLRVNLICSTCDSSANGTAVRCR